MSSRLKLIRNYRVIDNPSIINFVDKKPNKKKVKVRKLSIQPLDLINMDQLGQ